MAVEGTTNYSVYAKSVNVAVQPGVAADALRAQLSAKPVSLTMDPVRWMFTSMHHLQKFISMKALPAIVLSQT